VKELPTGWVETNLGEVTAKLVDGSHNPPPKAETGLPMLSARNIMDGKVNFEGFRFIDPDLFEVEHRRSRVTSGDVLLTIVGTIGRSAVVSEGIEPFTLQRSVAVMTPTKAIQSAYLSHFFHSATIQRWFEDNAKGTAQKGVYLGALAKLDVPLAPLPEQRRIVAKVDALTARTARARADLSRIPTLIARYKQRLLALAFSGELTAGWRAQHGDRETAYRSIKIETPFLYELRGPASWSFETVGSVCKIEGGSQPPKSTFIYQERPDYIRLIQIRDYKSDRHIVYIPKALARRFCSKTDIMIGRYGPPIFQILRGLEGSYNVALMKAVPLEAKILSDYLFWFLKHPTLFDYVELDSKRTSGQDGVNRDHLEKFPVPLPPLPEQAEIVRRIESAFGWLDRMAADHAAAARLIPKLDAAILTKAFRGDLVPQDPTDEPASVLLERIRAEREAAPKKGRGKQAGTILSSTARLGNEMGQPLYKL
jgi:type I restriction enzyme S subunit